MDQMSNVDATLLGAVLVRPSANDARKGRRSNPQTGRGDPREAADPVTRPRHDRRPRHPGGTPDVGRPVQSTRATSRKRRLPPGWPLTMLLVGYPVFWALGLVAFVLQIVAVPMAIELLRRRPVRVPRGFGIWILFLILSAAGILVLGLTRPAHWPTAQPVA